MSWKEELKESWQEEYEKMKNDVYKEWEFTYGEHKIRIENHLAEEKLFIDGK